MQTREFSFSCFDPSTKKLALLRKAKKKKRKSGWDEKKIKTKKRELFQFSLKIEVDDSAEKENSLGDKISIHF